jgi:hypothetical protein
VTITGTVTVEPGRIIGDDVFVVQDGTGGVAVKVPAGVAPGHIERGRIVTVTGTLAAPYGNLEVRPKKREDLATIGQGGLPEPMTVTTADFGEDIEGRLVTITGTVVGLDRGSTGTMTITITDRDGEGKIHLHAPVGETATVLERDQSIRFTGIAGQRASRSGAADGYRVWPRDEADIRILSRPPQATPRPDEPGGGKPPRGSDRPRKVRISDAAFGDEVTILGSVTSAPGLIDSEGRRITVEDGSGGILVRLPADTPAPAVGRRIQVWGEVGTWYDAPQLEAAAGPRVRDRRLIKPVVLRRAPTEADESRLVVVVVRIEDVSKDGDTWRAEATLGAGGSLPIAGLAGSGIPSTALPEGRSATIVGIVRRAHPAATDQRYAVVPRSKADIRLGASVATGGSRAGGDGGTGDTSGDGDGSGAGRRSGSDGDGAPQPATFRSLEEHVDRMVRVGGRLERAEGSRLQLHDGTASGVVRLPDDSVSFVSSLVIGEVVNVTGRVRSVEDEPPEVVARSIADIQRAASLPDALDDPGVTGTADRLAMVASDTGPAAPATELEAALRRSGTRSEVPLPVLAMLAAILVTGVAGTVGSTTYVLWRRRPQASTTAPPHPTMTGH